MFITESGLPRLIISSAGTSIITTLFLSFDLVDCRPEHLALAREMVRLYSYVLKVPFHVNMRRSVTGCLEKGLGELSVTLAGARYNLVFLSHVLNKHELSHPGKDKEIIDFALSLTANDGTLALLEPATKDNADRLAGLHWKYKNGGAGVNVTAFSPCSYPWRRYPNRRCSCACWSIVKEPWHKPGTVALLERYGTPVKNMVKYTYFLLRRDGRNRYHQSKDPERHRARGLIRLSRLPERVNQSVSVLGVVIHICHKGDLLIIDLCDGTAGSLNYCHLEVRTGVPGKAGENLATVRHGDLLEIYNVEARPGSRGSKYTLYATEQTVVTVHRISGGTQGVAQ